MKGSVAVKLWAITGSVVGMTLLGLASAAATPTISGQVVPTSPSSLPFTLLNLGMGDNSGNLQSVSSGSTFDGKTITFSGSSGVYSGSQTGFVLSPFSDATNYLAAEPGYSVKITFAAPQTAFDLLVGSITKSTSTSPNNVMTFSSGDTVTAAEIEAAVPAAQDNVSNVAVELTNLQPFTSVSFTTANPAFEFVPGVPVPEPPTLALLGAGLVGLAAIGRRKETSG